MVLSMDTDLLLDQLRKEALDNILPFWTYNMVDYDNDGFLGRIDGKNQRDNKADKGIILNSRILWTLSKAAHYFDSQVCFDLAHRAYKYLIGHFYDHTNRGFYWLLNYKGQVLDPKKQIYAQAFCIYALTEFYLLTGNQQALALAQETFTLTEIKSFDAERNGYFEALDKEWEPLTDMRLSAKDMNVAKTMNTHLHLLEAYTNLYRCWKNPLLEHQLKNLIELFLDKFIIDGRLQLFFNASWEAQCKTISFGHDIECSWLLYEAAEVFGDTTLLERVRHVIIGMTDCVMQSGFDHNNGLNNEQHENGEIDREKHWWIQAEALVGLVNTWQLTGEEKYLNQAMEVWAFIQYYLVDKTGGEWYWKVDETGLASTVEDKAGLWKCPYHNTRAIIELLQRLKG